MKTLDQIGVSPAPWKRGEREDAARRFADRIVEAINKGGAQ